jgi:hypothetical protein
LNVLKENKYNLVNLQGVTINNLHSPAVCHKFRVLIVFSFSKLVLALAHTQLC